MDSKLKITEIDEFIGNAKHAWKLALEIIFKKHAVIISCIIFLIFLIMPIYIWGNEFYSDLALTAIGALIGTFFVFGFIEVSMIMEQENKWEKCKEYTFYVLNMSSAKLVNYFIKLKNSNTSKETPLEELNSIFMKESEWRDKILKDIAGKEISNYINTLDNINWINYSEHLINNDNTCKLEKMFGKLINIKIGEDIIDYLSKFLAAKERLNHLVGMGDYDLFEDGDGKRYAIETMLHNCVYIYNLTKDKIESWEEPEISL